MSTIIVIGSSTGGPRSLETIFSQIPENFSIPIIVAQHLASPYTHALAERLDKISPDDILVKEAEDGDGVQRGRAFVVPGNAHFFLYHPGPRFRLLPAHDLEQPSIDMGFTSVAEQYGPHTIGVVLSGMGEDGMIGARAIRQLGGVVLAQDEATSTIYGMPRVVKEAGLADRVLPLKSIIPYIIEHCA